MAQVVILDYGSGNLRSAERALERAGADVEVTADHRAAVEAEPTLSSQLHATRLVNAIDQREVVLAAPAALALLDAIAPAMTPERVAAATERSRELAG